MKNPGGPAGASGEGRGRTGDLSIFSATLYQLSYLTDVRLSYRGVRAASSDAAALG